MTWKGELLCLLSWQHQLKHYSVSQHVYFDNNKPFLVMHPYFLPCSSWYSDFIHQTCYLSCVLSALFCASQPPLWSTSTNAKSLAGPLIAKPVTVWKIGMSYLSEQDINKRGKAKHCNIAVQFWIAANNSFVPTVSFVFCNIQQHNMLNMLCPAVDIYNNYWYLAY